MSLTDEQIKAVFLANGFTIKEGLSDLKPYVYQAARALLAAAAPPAQEAGKPPAATLLDSHLNYTRQVIGSTAPPVQRDAKPVAWRHFDDSGVVHMTLNRNIAEGWRDTGHPVEPLYAAPLAQRDAERDAERALRAFRAVIAHWDEFGPEHGFDESIDQARRALSAAKEGQGK